MPITKVGDINIYYEIHDDGEPLVMITGLGSNSILWFRQIPFLAGSYRVIAFDNRGTSRSDKPDIPYSMEMMAGDIAGLLDVIGIDRAHVYGHSMGGMIAQHFALNYPDRTISLVLACTSCGGRHIVLPDNETIAFLADAERRNRQTPEERVRESLSFTFTQKFIDNNPDIVEQFVSLTIKYWTPLYSYMRQVEAVIAHDTYNQLHEIKVPTLVIAGAADRTLPIENLIILASRIPNAELVTMKHLGHGLFIEGVADTNKAILDFLKRHPKAS